MHRLHPDSPVRDSSAISTIRDVELILHAYYFPGLSGEVLLDKRLVLYRGRTRKLWHRPTHPHLIEVWDDHPKLSCELAPEERETTGRRVLRAWLRKVEPAPFSPAWIAMMNGEPEEEGWMVEILDRGPWEDVIAKVMPEAREILREAWAARHRRAA